MIQTNFSNKKEQKKSTKQTIATIWRENMLEKRKVQRQKCDNIFAPNVGYCVYSPSNIFRNARSFWKLENIRSRDIRARAKIFDDKWFDMYVWTIITVIGYEFMIWIFERKSS